MSTATVTPLPSGARALNLIACAWCDRIRLGGRWVSETEAIDLLRSFEHALPPSFTVTTCATCRSRIERRRAAAGTDGGVVGASEPSSGWSHAA
jgi:hypothetical protein